MYACVRLEWKGFGVAFILLHNCDCTKLKAGRVVVFQSGFELQLQHPFPLKGCTLHSL